MARTIQQSLGSGLIPLLFETTKDRFDVPRKKKPQSRTPATRKNRRSEVRKRSFGRNLPVSESVMRAKQEWQESIDALPQLVLLLDAQGNVIRVNRTIERWGLQRVTESAGHDFHSLLHHECQLSNCYLRKIWQNAHDDLVRDGAWSFESADTLLNRRLRIDFQRVNPGASEASTKPYVVAMIDDVSDRHATESTLRQGHATLSGQISLQMRELVSSNNKLRQEIDVRRSTERELRRSEVRYRQLVDTMLEGLVIYDPEHIIVYANDSLCQTFGCSREKIVGLPVDQVFPGLAQAAHTPSGDSVKTGPCQRHEAEWRTADGKSVTVLVSVQRLTGPSGTFLGEFAVVMDITERKRAENAMSLLSTQLLAAQELERKRIADELHDSVGQMLGALKFTVEDAAERVAQDAVPDLAKMLSGLTPKFQSIVDEVRRISMDLRPAMLDDLGVVATIAWFCREYQNIYRGIKLNVTVAVEEADIPSSLNTTVYRIVQETLSNVAAHAQARRVQLLLKKKDNALVLEIADDGIGFDPDSITPSRDSRRGLGLRTMRERAESAGGKFHIESADGGGTRVYACWPLNGHGG